MAGNPLINSTVNKNRFGRFGAQGQQTQQGQQTPGFFGQGTYGAQNAQSPYAQQAQPNYAQPGYAEPAYEQAYAPAAPIGERATMDDVIMKTGLTLAMVVLGAAVGWYMPILMYVGMLAGLILGIVNAMKSKPVPALVLLYGLAEGLFLGGLSGLLNVRYPGIALQAVLATVAVFGVMLFLFANGKVRATPKLNKIFFAATLGLLGYYLLSMGVGLFTGMSFNSFVLPGTNMPLLETMHGPTGCSGVQARPNSGQPPGVMAPRSTSPQRQPRGSTVGSTSTAKRRRASKRRYASRIARPDPGIGPSPRHVASHGSKTRSTRERATGLPSSATPRR